MKFPTEKLNSGQAHSLIAELDAALGQRKSVRRVDKSQLPEGLLRVGVDE